MKKVGNIVWEAVENQRGEEVYVLKIEFYFETVEVAEMYKSEELGLWLYDFTDLDVETSITCPGTASLEEAKETMERNLIDAYESKLNHCKTIIQALALGK